MNVRLIPLLAVLTAAPVVAVAATVPEKAAAPTPAVAPAATGLAVTPQRPARRQKAGAATAPRVTEAWVAEAPPTARHNAAYLVLRNGNRADTLLAVETPVAEVVELHEMRMDQGVMRMRQERSVALGANAELRLAPGGRHLMLINMKRALRPGEQVPLTLRFRRAGALTVQAEVRPLPVDDGEAAGQSSQGHMQHMHMH